MRAAAWSLVAILVAPSITNAQPNDAPTLTDLAMPAGDDAREAIAIGPNGEAYEPDGKGAWVRTRAVTLAGAVDVVGRANGVVVLANGAVFRLAPNGWSALRLVQKGKAVMSGGARSVAAVGRQLFALDRVVGGEVAKLVTAPAPVQMLGTGTRALTIQTERGLFRSEGPGSGWKQVARAPRSVSRLIDDRWALVERGAVDLKTGTVTTWPAGFVAGAATPGPKSSLVVVGALGGAIEVATITGGNVTRETIEIALVPEPTNAKPAAPTDAKSAAPADAKSATPTDAKPAPADLPTQHPAHPLTYPVGVAVDSSGRVVVAFRDGRIAKRERGVWSLTTVVDALPAPRPGSPPASAP